MRRGARADPSTGSLARDTAANSTNPQNPPEEADILDTQLAKQLLEVGCSVPLLKPGTPLYEQIAQECERRRGLEGERGMSCYFAALLGRHAVNDEACCFKHPDAEVVQKRADALLARFLADAICHVDPLSCHDTLTLHSPASRALALRAA